MKILAASDLHGNEDDVKRLADYAEEQDVDLVLIAGDIADFGESAIGMIGPFLAKGKRVAFVTGNHETPGLGEVLSEKYHVADIQKHAIVYDDVGIFGCGGANIGFEIFPEKDIFGYLQSGFGYVKSADKKVMLTHAHPRGSKVEEFSFPGSEAVTKAIYKFRPDIHICGHIHEMEGFEEIIGKTRIFCVGSRGKVIEI